VLAARDGDLYRVTGPILFADPPRLHDDAAIPAYMFKAVYDPKTRQAIAYVASNMDAPVCWVISIRQFIQMSGIDPFPSLSTEAKSEAAAWALPQGANKLPSPDYGPA
jgi:endonuclease G